MQKLDALTTLRFFAAIGIVLYHVRGYYGVSSSEIFNCFSHGVAFFFVLSGFILAYVYPTFESQEHKKKFFIARIARIWPAHLLFFSLVCLLTLFGFISNHGTLEIFFLNIFMLQAWIPIKDVYFSFNSPSWSISAEFFFYLCFPFIIHNWAGTWHWKTIGVFLFPFLLMSLSSYFHLPDYSNSYNGINNHGLLCANPLARIPEFVLGVFSAYVWMNNKKWFEMNCIKGTVFEIASIILVALNIYYYDNIFQFISHFVPQYISHEFKIWTGAGVFTSLSFGLLIMVLASGKGLIAKILSFRLGIILGEISFSIYLFHQIIHRFYLGNMDSFENVPYLGVSLAYWIILLSGSFLVWKYVERPSRNWILNKFTKTKKVLETYPSGS